MVQIFIDYSFRLQKFEFWFDMTIFCLALGLNDALDKLILYDILSG